MQKKKKEIQKGGRSEKVQYKLHMRQNRWVPLVKGGRSQLLLPPLTRASRFHHT